MQLKPWLPLELLLQVRLLDAGLPGKGLLRKLGQLSIKSQHFWHLMFHLGGRTTELCSIEGNGGIRDGRGYFMRTHGHPLYAEIAVLLIKLESDCSAEGDAVGSGFWAYSRLFTFGDGLLPGRGFK